MERKRENGETRNGPLRIIALLRSAITASTIPMQISRIFSNGSDSSTVMSVWFLKLACVRLY